MLKHKLSLIILGMISILSFSACSKHDPELAKFKTEMDDFCTSISKIDTSINQIDAQSDTATSQLLGYLDDLNGEFSDFAELDFPKEYDYLESLADEAGAYMNEAVRSYHETYSDNAYNESMAEYARANYSRAYKRIQIIISFLHGEEPDDVDLVISTDDATE